MASKYVKDLRAMAEMLAVEGWPLRTQICRDSADRMERLEQLIVDAKDRFDDIADCAITQDQAE